MRRATRPARCPFYQQVAALQRRLLGPAHPSLAFTLYNYAEGLFTLGHCRSRMAAAREVIAMRDHGLPKQRNPVIGAAHMVLAKDEAALGNRAGSGRIGA